MTDRVIDHGAPTDSTVDGAVPPVVSVVVVTGDRIAELARLLESLAANTGDDPPWELVVVDNASTDDTAALLAVLEGDVVIVRSDRPLRYGDALRRGVDAASGSTIVVCDVGVTLAAQWLTGLHDALWSDGHLGIVATVTVSASGDVAAGGLAVLPDGALHARGAGYASPANLAGTAVDAVPLVCAAIRADALASVDGIDAGQLGPVFCGADLSMRLAAQGWSAGLVAVDGVTWDGRADVAEGGRRFASTWRAAESPDDSNGPRSPMRPERDVRTVALHLPQFHPIAENDRWWGPGFTEWRNVVQAAPRFDGHRQPQLPADLGFYDLRLDATRAAQAELASRYGIDAFCYYHYWFGGRRLLHEPVDAILDSGEPDLPFMLCWANEDWRSNWDGRSGEVLVEQRYSDADDLAHIRWLVQAFADDRYLRVDGKPAFAVYRASLLPDPVRTTDLWRKVAADAGIGDLYLCRVESFPEDRSDPEASGFDAAIEFQPDWTRCMSLAPVGRTDRDDTVYDYGALVRHMLAKPAVPWRRHRGVAPGWDNTARRRREAFIVHGSTPARYEGWLSAAVELERADRARTGGDGLVFVNAWNEWAEGAHLEPCLEWGHGFLEAHARGVGRRTGAPIVSGADRRLRANDAVAVELAGRADEVADTAPDLALSLVMAAADHRWYAHGGTFVDRRLERIAASIGTGLGPAPAPSPDARSTDRREDPRTPTHGAGDERPLAVHVLTEAHRTGGHTRLAWRWMAQDSTHRHTAVLVNQGTIEIPEALWAAADRIDVLDADRDSPTGRARRLREIVADADVVVLHIHPYDAITLAALAWDRRPPVVFLNHAGHVFWLGADVADVIACVRPVELELAATRRGIHRDRLALFPTSVAMPTRRERRDVAAARIGIGDHDAVVLCTMAAPYKYDAVDGLSFCELVVPLLERDPRLHLVAVGPRADGAWADLSAVAPGRVHATGMLDDPQRCLEAAHVYLDSHPLTSPTSMLEAVSLGVPAVSFAPDGVDVLGADDVGFGDALLRPRTRQAFVDDVARLVGDDTERADRGAALAAGVRSVHGGEAWHAALERVYAAAARRSLHRDHHPVPVAPMGDVDRRLLALHEDGAMVRPIERILSDHGLRPADLER